MMMVVIVMVVVWRYCGATEVLRPRTVETASEATLGDRNVLEACKNRQRREAT